MPFVLSGERLKKSAINYRKSFHRLSGVIALATRWIYAMPVPKFQRACNFQLQGCYQNFKVQVPCQNGRYVADFNPNQSLCAAGL